MPKILLPVPHRRQGRGAECLAACSAMVLDYLNVPLAYEKLIALLDVQIYGTPRRNILALNRHGVTTAYREAAPDLIVECLQSALPVIAFVYTGELAYWQGHDPTNHAVVVVGIDGDNLLLNDPAFTDAPKIALAEEFYLAWQECDMACAVLSLP